MKREIGGPSPPYLATSAQPFQQCKATRRVSIVSPHRFFLIIGGSQDTIESRLVCKRDQGARYQCSFRKGKGWGKNIAHPLF